MLVPPRCRALAHASCSSVFELKGCLELLLLLQRSALQADHPNPLAAGKCSWAAAGSFQGSL